METKLTAYIVCLVIASLFIITNAAGIQQSLVLHSEENCRGNAFPILEKTPDLNQLNWTLTASVKFLGRWILYSHPYYNVDAQGNISNFMISTNFIQCRSFRHVVSSVRYVGLKHSMDENSITLYERPDFQGKEKVLVENDDNLEGVFKRGTVRSLIATGDVAWTVFESPNYQGETVCILPNQKGSLLTKLSKINYKIKSVRLYCASPQK